MKVISNEKDNEEKIRDSVFTLKYVRNKLRQDLNYDIIDDIFGDLFLACEKIDDAIDCLISVASDNKYEVGNND